MNALRFIMRELVGLVVDDEFLAAAILVVTGLAALLRWSGAAPLAAGAVLLFGLLFVLAASAARGRKS